jgi:hypothetical protein
MCISQMVQFIGRQVEAYFFFLKKTKTKTKKTVEKYPLINELPLY